MRKLLAVVTSGLLLGTMMLGPAGAVAAPIDFAYTRTITSTGGGSLANPCGITIDKFGRMYVVQYGADVVEIYNADGTHAATWGQTGSGDGDLDSARDVEVDRWGHVYVLERDNDRVSVFNPYSTGYPAQFVRHISGPGIGDALLDNPQGLAVSLDGDVYVSDNQYYIKHFDKYDNHINTWTSHGRAMGMSCDQDGDLWVANDYATAGNPSYGNTFMKYSPSGAMLGSWGETGTADGEFDRTYDIATDGGGRVYVLDSEGDRVQAFSDTGTFLGKYAAEGSTPSFFWWPYGVAAGYQREFGVADYGNHRVVSFETDPVIPAESASVSGANRYETAQAASQLGWDSADTAVVATALNWPDALSGAGLAGASEGPLLLTNPSSLSAEAASELSRLGCSKVYVLGGTSAVSSAVFAQIEAIVGIGNVERLGGTDRYATSALIAIETVSMLGGEYDGTGVIATGRDFPDALAASPIVAANKWPILLTEPDALPAVIADAMTSSVINHGYLIGGTSAIGPDAFDDIDALWIGTPYRVSGANRYETAAATAELGFTGLGMMYSRPALATGENFPDALAGGVLQGSDYSVMLLTPTGSLHPDAAAALTAHKDSIYEMRYLGGTSALSTSVRTSTEALLH